MTHLIDDNMVFHYPYRWGDEMPTVKVSPKFQVVIPKEVRESMGIEPGQELAMLVYEGRIVLLPILPMEELRGFAKGIDTTIERDPDRL